MPTYSLLFIYADERSAKACETPFYPLECRDRLAFWAGYSEGRAARKRAADAAGDKTSNV